MIVQKIISFAKRLEDPKYPLLGPNLKGLYVYGLWQSGSKLRNRCYNFIYFCAFLFVTSQLIELWTIRHDYLEALQNLSITALAMVTLFKAVSFIIWQSGWKELVKAISTEELAQLQRNLPCEKLMRNYTIYARVITYLYWNIVIFTNITMVSAPFLKYATTPEYREQIKNKIEPLPQIISSWFPFDKTEMPGYSVAIFIHIVLNIYGGGVIALYDSNAVTIMVFIKGQLAILKDKCRSLFDDDDDKVERIIILDRIKECHRHHNFILKQSTLFNSLLSPVMFFYILICSGMICCSVVQFTLDESTAAQKLWVVEYTIALISQLFLYCWHSNEVVVECNNLDRGLYESEWWKADVRVRKQLVLLGGKLTHAISFSAGPFTTLSVPTFIDVMKGSYSFLTLLTQMQKEE